jgi:hypothetical protein
MIGVPKGKNLGLVLQPAKRPRVDDAIAVTLERVAVRMFRLRITPAEGIFYSHRVCREHARSITRGLEGH